MAKITIKTLRSLAAGAIMATAGLFALTTSADAQQFGYGYFQQGQSGTVVTPNTGQTVQGIGQAVQGVATGPTRTVLGERYIPNIWVDPDGCEHWVMDDGIEGYMTPHTNRQGIPVCRRGNVCGIMNSDQFFATNSYKISQSGRQQLANFFRSSPASAYIVAGHTDSRASDQYNMRLSYNRANSVAAVARSVGARIADVRGYGERMPRASNRTRNGMAQNRRVEIICIR